MFHKFAFTLTIFACVCFSGVVQAAPRFASLKYKEVNMRTGPGERFPIDWVYQEKNYPVEIIDEFEFWRKVREFDGTTGWVHRAMLASTRYGLVLEETRMYAKPVPGSKTVAIVAKDALGKIVKCPEASDFCLMDFGTVKGWMDKGDFWGLYSKEIID